MKRFARVFCGWNIKISCFVETGELHFRTGINTYIVETLALPSKRVSFNISDNSLVCSFQWISICFGFHQRKRCWMCLCFFYALIQVFKHILSEQNAVYVYHVYLFWHFFSQVWLIRIYNDFLKSWKFVSNANSCSYNIIMIIIYLTCIHSRINEIILDDILSLK